MFDATLMAWFLVILLALMGVGAGLSRSAAVVFDLVMSYSLSS
jgi:hypothetical protein